MYLGNNISSSENDVNIYIGNAGTVINCLTTIRQSDLQNKIKRE